MKGVWSAVATLAVAALLSGCGTGNRVTGRADAKTSVARGAKVFHSAGCGACHTLEAARSSGQIGPNLDVLKPSRATVANQVAHGGNGMPAFAAQLTPRQIADVADYVSTSAAGDPGISAIAYLTFHPTRSTLASCRSTDFMCLRQAFGNLAYFKGPQIALKRLETASRTNAFLAGTCHQITHEIGHAAYARYHGNTAEALSQGSMTCWSGYYHGVIERAFAGVAPGRVVAVARTLCAQVGQTDSFLRYQCVHGLGHGLMIYSANNLPYALRVCDSLETRWDQQSCTGGVFMQNFLPGAMGGSTRWEKKSDLLYPCDAVAQRDKLYCYLIVTSRILPAVRYDWKMAAAWCRRSERGWTAICFQSLGRDASGDSRQSAQGILRICRVAADYESDCIYGAARDVTSNDAGARRAAPMCSLAPREFRSRCFEGIGSILGGLHLTRASRRAACAASIPTAYRIPCYRGAAAF